MQAVQEGVSQGNATKNRQSNQEVDIDKLI